MKNELQAETAIAHLSMLHQAALGGYTETPARLTQRFELILHYLRTGECAIDAENSAFAQAIAELMPKKAEAA